MSTPALPTPTQTQAIRDPAEVLLAGEIRDLMKRQAEHDRLEEYHRSIMINHQLEQMKIQAQVDSLQAALRLVQHGAMS